MSCDDLHRAAFGGTLPSWWAPQRDAILQPPKSLEITPAARILQLSDEHDVEPEAGE